MEIKGVTRRGDRGSQQIGEARINEVKRFGITTSLSYMGEPRHNSVAGGLMRLLNEHSLYAPRSKNRERANALFGRFADRYGPDWLIDQLGPRTAVQARAGAYAPRQA